MDIRTKLWVYSPTSEYLTDDASGDGEHDTLLEWRDEGVPQPDAQDLDDAEAAYNDAVTNGPLALSVDKTQIAGDGQDTATVTATYYLPHPDVIEVDVNGEAVVLDVSNGSDTIAITSTAAVGTEILVEGKASYQGIEGSAQITIEVI